MTHRTGAAKRATSMAASIIAAGFTAIALHAQQPRDGRPPVAGTASISGTVVMADGISAPARHATVEIAGAAMLTDDNGRFSFAKLPAGAHLVVATKSGFLPAAYGAKRPAGPGVPIEIRDGQQVTGIEMRLVRGSVLAGVITDQFSHPTPNTEVRAYRYGVDANTGQRMPVAVTTGLGITTTDDKGQYRLYGLEPGEYIVSAAGPPAAASLRAVTADDVRYALQLLKLPAGVPPDTSMRRPQPVVSRPIGSGVPVFYPSAESVADATRIALGLGEERQGVDVARRPVSGGVVKGSVGGPWAAISDGGKVYVIDTDSPFVDSKPWGTQGGFVFDLAPGHYQLVAIADNGGFIARGEAFVVAGGDYSLGLILQPGATITGRVVFQRTSAQDADPTLVHLSLVGATRADFPYRTSPLKADGKFSWTNVPAGSYRLGVTTAQNLQPGWRVKSAKAGDVELLDGVFDVGAANIGDVVITLTDARSEISGTLQATDGTPVSDYSVLVFSADRQFWRPMSRRTQVVRPASNGRFAVRDLPEGDYLIVALNDIETGQWHSADFLAELAPFAVKVTLGDGEKKVRNLKIGGGYSTR